MSRRVPRTTALLVLGALCTLSLGGCDKERAANAQRMILKHHAPQVARVVLKDLALHQAGLKRAAERIAPGFVKVEGDQQEKDMRFVLKLLRSPKKGIPELIISPMSSFSAVNLKGVVIARNVPAEQDKMKGMNLAAMFPVVQAAIEEGKTGYAIAEFENPADRNKPSVTVLMASPSYYKGEIVGALVLDIPLWRLAQRLSKQLQMESAGKGIVLWVWLYRQDRIFFKANPDALNIVVPDGEARRAGLAKSPGGFTGEFHQFSSWYGYGVRPLRVLGDDVGLMIVRMDPQ